MKFKFSCALDNSPLLPLQSYIWLNNLLANGIEPEDIYIHIIGSITEEYKGFLRKAGINVIFCETFDDRNLYCNKLQQLSTFEADTNFDYVFLMDCDTTIVSLDGLELKEKIYAKVVDFPNPPMAILEKLFEKEGFDVQGTTTSFPLNGENITDWNNCNGGVYIIHKDFLPHLAPSWKQFAKKCIEEKQDFTALYDKHADQVGFALAMASLNEKVTHLDIAWNFPTHIDSKGLEVQPKILHYHDKINSAGEIQLTGNPVIDRSIKTLNEDICKGISKDFDKIHPRDIGEERLMLALLSSKREKYLRKLVNQSRETFGFYTSHFSRVFEYTWILEKLENFQGKILDIGAGVGPLPLCLAKNGNQVYTVDGHPVIREEDNKQDWNEWGYLDYSKYNSNIESFNINFDVFESNEKLDAIYSVSVIEHMPAKDRRKIIKKSAGLLKKGGEFLLTVDVVPNTNKIWNLSENKEVESFSSHGKIKTLKRELVENGFMIREEFLQRNILDSRTDVYYVRAEYCNSLWSKLKVYV